MSTQATSETWVDTSQPPFDPEKSWLARHAPTILLDPENVVSQKWQRMGRDLVSLQEMVEGIFNLSNSFSFEFFMANEEKGSDSHTLLCYIENQRNFIHTIEPSNEGYLVKELVWGNDQTVLSAAAYNLDLEGHLINDEDLENWRLGLYPTLMKVKNSSEDENELVTIIKVGNNNTATISISSGNFVRSSVKNWS